MRFSHFMRKGATLTAAGIVLWCAGAARASAATLSFSPSSGTYFTGRSFTVAVQASSPDQAMNAVQGQVSFPADKLQVLSVSKANSILTLWVQDPTFSNQDGTVNFSGVVVNPGFQGTGGTIITITFAAKAPGTAALSFLSASILANDGKGTGILSGIQPGASFSLQGLSSSPSASAGASPASTIAIVSAPIVASGKWYDIDHIAFSWSVPADADGVDYSISQNSNFQLPDVDLGLASRASYDLTSSVDGPWFFLVSFRSGSDWSKPAVKKFLLDRTAPDPFVISLLDADPYGDRPTFSWAAIDRTSGIDHYSVKVGDGDWFDAASIEVGSSTYRLPAQSPAESRTITVRAVDKAGNYRDASLDFKVFPANEACGGRGISCGAWLFFSDWGWLVGIVAILLLLVAYLFMCQIYLFNQRMRAELGRFEKELRGELKEIKKQGHSLAGLEREVGHVAEEVKDEIKRMEKQ